MVADSPAEGRVDRRTLLKGALAAGGALAGGGAFEGLVAGSARAAVPRTRQRAPNILVIMVDQLRTPQWFQTAALTAV
jgi:F0F1-type ATP synthase membrane subunit c/vacuolar-type H+-ATPase subunit K